MSRTKTISVSVAVAAAAVLSGCGSTVSTAGNSAATSAGGLGAPSASSGESGGPGSGASGVAPGVGGLPGQQGAQPGTSGAAGGSGAGSSAAAVGGGSGGVRVAGPGITASSMFIGLTYSSDTNSAQGAIGASGAATSYDTRSVWQAVINYADKHGGFAGRQLKPLWYQVHSTDDTNSAAASACAFWTQDHKVFVMPTAGSDILNACAEKAHAVPLGSGTSSTLRKYPHLIDPDAIRLDRLGRVTVNGLFHSRYFTGKLGLVTWDDPTYRDAVNNGYLPALAQHHISLALPPVYIAVPQQMGALGDMTAAVSSAVTKFKAMGIDHVIIQDGAAGVWGGTGLTFEWMNQAESQKYFPRYGQNEYNAPGWAVLPQDQMNRAIAVDQSDYDAKFDQGWKANRTRELCYKIERDAGMPVASSNANDETSAAMACDAVFFIQAVVNHTSVLSADGFLAGAGTLGSLGSALTYGSKLVPGLRDGGDLVRNEEYDSSCQCMHYLGPPYSPTS